MNLKTRMLLLPGVAIALMIALLAGAAFVVKLQARATDDTRFAGALESGILETRAGVIETTARAYRMLTLVGSLDAAKVSAERKQMAERFSQLGKRLTKIAEKDPDGLGVYAFDLSSTIDQLAKKVDSAVDLATVDPNTGAGAMQSADVLFKELTRNIDEAFEAARQKAAQIEQSRTASIRIAMIAMAIAAVVAAGLLIVMSTLIARGITGPLASAVEVAKAIADGDLDRRIGTDGAGEIGELQRAVAEMQNSLKQIVSRVREGGVGISNAAAEIATGNNDLSARTEEAASSLEQTAASIDHLTQTVQTNADNARQANQLALSASEVAERGGTVVGNVVSTMDTITQSSRRIAEIITVIDGIAFQTNILALNAAVEAARAGEQGRGFAVVAGEVRNLAQRSSAAANEIKALITTSVGEVDSGARLVKEAGDTMSEIVTSVRRVTDIIGEISAATSEQSTQIVEVNSAVGQLDQMTQQNAALVEQSAASAESLKEQAVALNGLVAAFRLGESTAPAARSPAARAPAVTRATAPAFAKAPAKAPAKAEPAGSRPAKAASASSGPGPRPYEAEIPRRAPAAAAQGKEATMPKKVSVPAHGDDAPKAAATRASDDEWETF